MRVAIIGAGISGLACARRLRDAGLEATLFDKSRGIGGRLATRRANPGNPEVAFDHGATHFTARSEGFTKLVAAWEQASSDEHTSELQSLMRLSYAVFCLKNKT